LIADNVMHLVPGIDPLLFDFRVRRHAIRAQLPNVANHRAGTIDPRLPFRPKLPLPSIGLIVRLHSHSGSMASGESRR
jgi:hypothetical protein